MPGEEILNAENDVQEDVADSQSAGDDDGIDLSDPPKAGTPEGAENTDDKKTPEQKYSERLNKDREKLRGELEEKYAPKLSRLSELEIENKALREGKSVEDVRAEVAEEDKTRRELIENDPEYKRMKAAEEESHKNALLKVFQDAYPDDNITDLKGIDQRVFRMIVAGEDPVLAYKFVRDTNQQKQPPKKDLPGSVKSDGPAVEKESYTREEVKGMSQEEVNKNFEAIAASMKKWE